MKTWEASDIDDMSANMFARAANDRSVSDDKEQTLCLANFVQEWALTQEVKEHTHAGNTLDLLFTNKSDSIDEIEILENATITDHSLIIATLTRESLKDTEETKHNFCTTEVPKFNLRGASTEAWAAARKDLSDSKFDENRNSEELCDDLIKTLETIVIKNFEKFSPPSRSSNKTKNFIHRDARRLMRKKLNACRSLKTTTDLTKQDQLRSKIRQIEDDLRKQEHKKRQNDENKARHDLSKIPCRLL